MLLSRLVSYRNPTVKAEKHHVAKRGFIIVAVTARVVRRRAFSPLSRLLVHTGGPPPALA